MQWNYQLVIASEINASSTEKKIVLLIAFHFVKVQQNAVYWH